MSDQNDKDKDKDKAEAPTPAAVPEATAAETTKAAKTKSAQAKGNRAKGATTEGAAKTADARRGSGAAFFALVFSIAALLAVAALYYRDDTQRELADFHTQTLLQNQADTLAQLSNALAKQRMESRSGRDQLTARLDDLQTRVETQQQQLTTLRSTDRSDWQLSEAEYLMRLADQRLLFGGDPKTAVEQLLSVDNILHRIDDSALLPTRAALAKDIAALKAVDVIDTDGIYLEIDAVAARAQQLHLIEPVTMKAETPAVSSSATLTERLRTGLGAALRKLFQLVQIRRRDQPYQPLLAPEYETALRQNVRLAFEQAQEALLMSNQKLYEHSLAKARELLSTYYTIDEHATQAVLAQIDELKAKRVEVTLPDISESQRELKAYIKMRQTKAGVQP